MIQIEPYSFESPFAFPAISFVDADLTQVIEFMHAHQIAKCEAADNIAEMTEALQTASAEHEYHQAVFNRLKTLLTEMIESNPGKRLNGVLRGDTYGTRLHPHEDTE